MKNDDTFLHGDFLEEGPDDSAGPIGLPLARTPQSGCLVLTILSDHLLGCWTHYFRRRTQPCLGGECFICGTSSPRRWYGWLIGYDLSKGQKSIVEVPAAVALHLRSYREKHASLRGHRIKLFRKSSKPNGPVAVEMAPPKIDVAMLPECPDIVALLCKVWQIKSLTPEEVRRSNIEIYTDRDDDYDAGAVVA